MHPHNLALMIGKVQYRLAHRMICVRLLDHLRRPILAAGHRVALIQRALVTITSKVIPYKVHGCRFQPSLECPGVAQLREPLPRPDKGILRHVRGDLRVATEMHRESINTVLVSPEEGLERALIARLCGFNCLYERRSFHGSPSSIQTHPGAD